MTEDVGIVGWLRKQLTRRAWTPADFARAMGVGNSTVSMWLNGERNPGPQLLERMADVLNADVDQLLALAGHRPPVFEVDPESPEGQLIPVIRRVQWTDERLFGAMRLLEGYIEIDKMREERGKLG